MSEFEFLPIGGSMILAPMFSRYLEGLASLWIRAERPYPVVALLIWAWMSSASSFLWSFRNDLEFVDASYV